MDSELNSMLQGMDGTFQSMLGAMMASAGVGGSDLSICAEGNWRRLPAGALFRAVNDKNADQVERLLQLDEYMSQVDAIDGDGGSALHILALQYDTSVDVAERIVKAFKEAGGRDILDIRAKELMSGETPLMAAACYGNYGVIKALIEAGASVDIRDDHGRTPLSRAEKHMKSPRSGEEQARQSLDIIRKALQKEKASGAAEKRGDVLRNLGNTLYGRKAWAEAAEYYTKSIACHEDHRAYGNRAAAYLADAIDRITNGRAGYRQLFKQTYMDAEKAVELEASYEKGWYRMAKGYLGFRELPRAKRAAANGLKHCPDSEHLTEIFAVLDKLGVPDEVADQESEEWKELLHRLYVEHWIGPVSCDWCKLNCMEHPIPKKCPWCNCPTDVELSDEDDDVLCILTVED